MPISLNCTRAVYLILRESSDWIFEAETLISRIPSFSAWLTSKVEAGLLNSLGSLCFLDSGR